MLEHQLEQEEELEYYTDEELWAIENPLTAGQMAILFDLPLDPPKVAIEINQAGLKHRAFATLSRV